MNSYMIWAAGLVLIATILIFRRLTTNKNKQTPHDVLQNKYAAGQITIYEYEQQKRQLYRDEDLKTKLFFLASLSKD